MATEEQKPSSICKVSFISHKSATSFLKWTIGIFVVIFAAASIPFVDWAFKISTTQSSVVTTLSFLKDGQGEMKEKIGNIDGKIDRLLERNSMIDRRISINKTDTIAPIVIIKPIWETQAFLNTKSYSKN
jgi:hypothetical protein